MYSPLYNLYTLPLRYSWTSTEVEEVNGASVLLAADVIYSDELTDALFSVLQKMMCPHSEKVHLVAMLISKT